MPAVLKEVSLKRSLRIVRLLEKQSKLQANGKSWTFSVFSLNFLKIKTVRTCFSGVNSSKDLISKLSVFL